MHQNSRIFVAGHRGLAGSAIVRRLRKGGFENLILRTSAEVDLRNLAETQALFYKEQPEYVILAAARVGGIIANDRYPVEFLTDNLAIQTSVIQAAYRTGVSKLLFLGSSCIYPRDCPQPIKEEYLLSGPLEHSNEAYAIAKIAGLKLCQAYNRQHGTNFICAMPANLYGSGDNYDLENSHVLPALIRKIHEAKEQNRKVVTLWGSGKPFREFLHSDDLAEACLLMMKHFDASAEECVLNVGTGEDVSILRLAHLVASVVGYEGEIQWDTSKPDGTPRKRLDIRRISALGWKPRMGLREGIEEAYRAFKNEFLVVTPPRLMG